MSGLSYLEKLLDGVEVEWLLLGDVTRYEQPGKYLVESSNYSDDFNVPVLTAGKTFILGYTDETHGVYNASQHPVIIFDDFTTANKWVDFNFKAKSSAMKMITSSDERKTLLKYVYYWLNTLPGELTDGDHKRQWISNFSNKKIPVPPLTIQSEIVRILDTFTALTNELTNELKLRQKQYNYYREQLLSFEEGEVEWKFLGDASFFEIANNGRKPVKSSLRVAGKTPYYGANNIQDYVDGYTHDGEYVLIAEDGSTSLECYSIQYTTGKFWANNHVHVVRGKSGVSSRFLYHYLHIVNFIPFLTGGVRAKLTKGQLVEIPVPIPCPDNPEKSLAMQSEIVRILDKFDTLTNSISEGLPREIELRKKQYEHYRNLLFSFPKPVTDN
ncbi:restriction endonuclease subunit S [Salmonella enterica]|nr:restriction endonuclease subunit S [Salmonella enterica]